MVKKRPKSSRHRGSHTHARGFKKKARGSGHKGGKGMSGSGKRADQKKTLVLKKYGPKYFGKSKKLRRRIVPKLLSINLSDIQNNLQTFVKRGKATEKSGTYTLNLKKYKILSEGELTDKITINAAAASKKAIEKAEAAGSKIVLPSKIKKENDNSDKDSKDK